MSTRFEELNPLFLEYDGIVFQYAKKVDLGGPTGLVVKPDITEEEEERRKKEYCDWRAEMIYKKTGLRGTVTLHPK